MGDSVLPLLRQFWGICLLQTAPQDLPSSRALMYLAAFCYFGVSLAIGGIQLGPRLFLPAALLDTGFLAVATAVMLWVSSHLPRFTQTYTALTGGGAILGLIALPVLVWQQHVGTGPEVGVTVPGLLLLLWTAWNIVVVGHVLRHALSAMFAVGIVLAVVYMYLAFKLAWLLFF